MHVHSSAVGLDPMSSYAAANERAAAAQRAAEVRKRLLRAAQNAGAGAGPEASFLIGRWLNHTSPPDQPQGQLSPASGYPPAAEGDDSHFA